MIYTIKNYLNKQKNMIKKWRIIKIIMNMMEKFIKI